MSSLFAHAAVGMALAGRGNVPWTRRLATAAAALAPDLDYPLRWFWGIRFPVRYTHSAGFCLGVAAAGALVLRMRGDRHGPAEAARLAAAAFSHLLLDALVGVYREPWLWPLSRVTFRLPFGILPSAGRLAWGNVFLYRNLAIEAAIVGPSIWMGMRERRARPAWLLGAALVMLIGLSAGAGLDRG